MSRRDPGYGASPSPRSALFGDDAETVAKTPAWTRHLVTLFAALIAITMVVVGLQWWESDLPLRRAGSIAWIAAGQLVILFAVVGRILRPGGLDIALRLLAILAFIAALGGTVALALATA